MIWPSDDRRVSFRMGKWSIVISPSLSGLMGKRVSGLNAITIGLKWAGFKEEASK